MGLQQFQKEEDSNSNSSSSSSSSSNSSSNNSSSGQHPFPKYKRVCPQAVVKEEGGELVLVLYPETESMPFKKDWYTAPWELNTPRPAEWEYVWWGEDELDLDRHRVQELYGIDLIEVLKDDPRLGLEYRRKAGKEFAHGGDVEEAQRKRTCQVCEDEIDLVYDDWEEVGKIAVCAGHSVRELREADLV